MKLISVIIPAYNPQPTLLEALKSVFNQTYKNIEVILVNDGSGDEHTKIFTEAKINHPELKLLQVNPNKGVAATRNLGASQANGEYIAFLDQDDLWAPEKLELQGKYLNENPDIDYITSRQRYFLADNVTQAPSWVKPEHINTSLPGFLPGTLMVRAAVFKKTGGFDESLKAGTDDVDWFFRANNGGLKTFEMPNEFLCKRIHGKNLSASALAHNRELLSVVKMNLQRKKAEQKQLSVIIPCYNGKKYIEETLKTITAQGDYIGEIIVVDDASTDGSAEYVVSLNYPKLSLYRLEKNQGISAARNYGVEKAKFPFIAFLDADDLWTNGRTEELLDAMQKKTTPWAFGLIEHFISEDKIGQVNYVLPPVQIGYFASAMLVTKEFFNKVGGFNKELRVGEFIDWYDRARSINSTPSIIENIVLKRRIHGANTSIMAESKNARDYLKVARDAIARKKQSA
ncbi:MAG TPA: hypothetical protein DIV86_06150 [Alphaproteobacteria bacterium]|nr:hypothetical protein [Alphaproteobacteria bacterium]